MSGAVSNQSISRSLFSVISGSSFAEGGNYLKNHDFQSLCLSVLSFFTKDKWGKANADLEIEQKITTLNKEADKFSKAFIEAPRDESGNYSCTVEVEEGLNGIQPATTFNINCTTDKLTTSSSLKGSNGKVGEDAIRDIGENGPQNLKRALLQDYLKRHSADSEIIMDEATLDLSHIDDLSNIDFKGVTLDKHNLKCLIKKGGSLRGTNLAYGIDLQDVSFANVKIDRLILERLIREKVDLKQVDLREQDLTGLDAVKQNFSGANFANSNCRGAKFNQANFTGANFIDTNCYEANFNGANLTNISTSPEILDEKNQVKSGTNFQQSVLIEAIGARQAFENKHLPKDAFWTSTQVKEMYQDRRRDFDGLSLRKKAEGNIAGNFVTEDLKGSTFKNSQLDHTDFRGADLTNVNFEGADLDYIKVNEHTKLDNTNFSHATVKDVDLSTTTITDSTVIKGTILSGSKLNASWVQQAIDQKADIRGVYLIGDLSGLDLSELDLTGVNFAAVTNMQGTKLNRSGLIAAIASRSVPQPQEGKLNEPQVRQSTDLKGIVLKGTKDKPLVLSDADSRLDSTHVDFTGAILEHCDLSGAKLNYANFTDVDLSTTRLAFASGGSTVIIGDNDRKPYEEVYLQRLNFLINNTKNGNPDPVYEMSDAMFNNFRQAIFFPASEIGLASGDHYTYDNAPQNIYTTTYGKLDKRVFVNVPKDEVQKTNYLNNVNKIVNNNLLKQGFNKEQKVLFQHARAAIWATYNTFRSVRFRKAEQNPALVQSVMSDISSAEIKDEIYLQPPVKGDGGIPRLNQDMLGKTLNIVLEASKADGLRLSESEISDVRDFFIDSRFAW